MKKILIIILVVVFEIKSKILTGEFFLLYFHPPQETVYSGEIDLGHF